MDSSGSSEEPGEEVNFMESDDSPWYKEELTGSEDIGELKDKKQLTQGSFVLAVLMGEKTGSKVLYCPGN